MSRYIYKLKSGGYFPEPARYSIMLNGDTAEVAEITGINPQIICDAMNIAYTAGYTYSSIIKTANRII